MPRIPGGTSQSVPRAASQPTEFPSSRQPAVPPAPPARRPRSGGTPAGRFAEHAEGDPGASRRAAYAAFGWVLAFLAWHVVWAVTGLAFPQPSHFHGAALVLFWASAAIGDVIWAVGIVLPLALARPGGGRGPRWMLLWAAWIGCALLGARGIAGVVGVMVAVGIVLPLALARPWKRRVPRWMLLWAAWTGCALLGARGIAGVADGVARAIGFSRGLTGMTTVQEMGTGHPSAWLSFASTATEVLFLAGGLVFGLAALTYQRAYPRRRSAEHPAR
jgi:hypothetical protein